MLISARRFLAFFGLLLLGAAPAVCALEEDLPNEPATSLSTLGRKPDWSELDKYQATITHDEFNHLLHDVYAPHGYDADLIHVGPEEARVVKHNGAPEESVLHFAKTEADRLPLDRTWTPPAKLPRITGGAPLGGLHIALDPGHLGGRWAKMEERWFQIKKASPVQEGDMTLKVAQLLGPRLESLGAEVSFVRTAAEPLTPNRPSDFREIALGLLQRAGVTQPREDFNGPADPEKEKSIRWQEELLFYRNSEIRRRASLVNYRLQPDLVLCLHFNAEPWGDPANPDLVKKNHLHLLVNGAYLPSEIDLDDQRCEMLHKLLSQAYPEELGLADAIGLTMAKKTGLPPYQYTTPENVVPVGKSGYVYARNLMATRLYRCPTIYLEPYVMNSREVFARVEAGDYEGLKKVAGKRRPSIFREYVDGVVEGLVAYIRKTRP
jgi:hypothetical protein